MIRVDLDVMLAKRKMKLNELASRVGISAQNLSILKTGRAKAIRFSTLDKLCEVLRCQPGEILVFDRIPGTDSPPDAWEEGFDGSSRRQ